MSLQIPSYVTEEKDFERALTLNSIIAVYEGGTEFKLYRVVNYIKWTVPLILQIPALQNSISLSYNQPVIGIYNQSNPLFSIYNTPLNVKVIYVMGFSWSSPYISLTARDPNGQPFFQLSSSNITNVYNADNVYTTLAYFIGSYNRLPELQFNRKTDMFAPYPPQLPLPFKLWIKGYTIRYEDVGAVPVSSLEIQKVSLVAYEVSPFPSIFASTGG